MSDIFISYKREDRDRVEPLARALEHEGFSVWWDPELPIGQSYSSSIRGALTEARAVIPVWTALSVQSEWVQEEATHGKRRGVLFPVRLDAVDPPMGFTMVETVDLMDWQEGATNHEEWVRLLQQLRAKLRSPGAVARPDQDRVVTRRLGSREWFGLGAAPIAGVAAIVVVIVAALLLSGGEPEVDSAGATPAASDVPASTPSGRAAAAAGPVSPRDVPAPVLTAGANASFVAARQLAPGVAEPGEIFSTDDTRYYVVGNSLRVRDLAVVRLQNESTTLRPNMKIFNADKSQIADPYDGTPGASVQHVLTLTPGQPIYLQVLPYNSVGKYKVSVTPQNAFDSFEPNDDALTPTAAKVGTDITANVMDKQDPDFYRFSGVTNPIVKVTFENLSTTLRPNLKVYDANKSQIADHYDGTPGANLNFEINLKQARDFYLEVTPYNSSGKYRLRVD